MTLYKKEQCSEEKASPADPKKEPKTKQKQEPILASSYNQWGRSQLTDVPGSANLNKKQTFLVENSSSHSSFSSPACQHNLRPVGAGSQPACPGSSPDPGKTVGKLLNPSSQLQQPRPEIEMYSQGPATRWEEGCPLGEEEDTLLWDQLVALCPQYALVTASKSD